MFLLVGVQLSAAHSSQGLRPKQPSWRPEIVETYAEGQPMRVIYVEEKGSETIEWKQVVFYPSGQICSATILIVDGSFCVSKVDQIGHHSGEVGRLV